MPKCAPTTAKVVKMICTDTPLKEERFKNSVMRQQQGPVNKQNLDVFVYNRGALFSSSSKKRLQKQHQEQCWYTGSGEGPGTSSTKWYLTVLLNGCLQLQTEKVRCIRVPPRTFTRSLASRHRSARTAHHFKEKFWKRRSQLHEWKW